MTKLLYWHILTDKKLSIDWFWGDPYWEEFPIESPQKEIDDL